MIDRYERMVKHLLAQFTDTEVLKAVFYAVSEELAEIDVVLDDLQNNRWIDTGEGVQLDGIGQIVSRDRNLTNAIALSFFGFEGQLNTKGFGQARFKSYDEPYLASMKLSDTEYRMFLWAKVFKNNSFAYGNDTLRSLQYVFNTKNILVQNVGNAKINIGIGRKLTDNEKLLLGQMELFVKPAGVGLIFLSEFEGYVFGFKGQIYAKGFGQAPFASAF